MTNIDETIRESAINAIQLFAENNPQLANQFFDSIRIRRCLSRKRIWLKNMLKLLVLL